MGSRNYDEGSDWELVQEMIEVMLWKAPTHLFSRLLRIGRSSNCMNHLKDWMGDMRLKAASEATSLATVDQDISSFRRSRCVVRGLHGRSCFSKELNGRTRSQSSMPMVPILHQSIHFIRTWCVRPWKTYCSLKHPMRPMRFQNSSVYRLRFHALHRGRTRRRNRRAVPLSPTKVSLCFVDCSSVPLVQYTQ